MTTVYRKCRCTVYALHGLYPVGRCKKCGVKPTEEPDYQDYVEVREELAALRRELRRINEGR